VIRISQCLLDAFDREPEIKARIAAAWERSRDGKAVEPLTVGTAEILDA
jgi:hypothetical protein